MASSLGSQEIKNEDDEVCAIKKHQISSESDSNQLQEPKKNIQICEVNLYVEDVWSCQEGHIPSHKELCHYKWSVL